MKLIEQIALWNREGNADKVYEVDLCEVGPERYVVNFRYGRRGALLRDGTKTGMPVPLAEAKKIFGQLVAEKKKGGYQEMDRYQSGDTAAPSPAPFAGVANIRTGGDKDAWLLQRLREAAQPNAGTTDNKWPLSRIIWRAGERRLAGATPLLIPLLMKGDALQQYAVCWALGRCGDPSAIPLLEGVYHAAASKEMVRRIALVGWLALENRSTERKTLLDAITGMLPPELKQALEEDIDLTAFLLAELGKNLPYNLMEPLYLLAGDRPDVHAAMLKVLRDIPLAPKSNRKNKNNVPSPESQLPAAESGTFKTLRHLFKIAEFREDGPIFGVLAYRLEQEKAFFNFSRYGREYGIYAAARERYYQNPATELKKPDSTLAFSNRTKTYFNRRVWRTLKTLGNDSSENYVRMASAVLLCYSDARDKTEPVVKRHIIYEYDRITNRYVGTTTKEIHYDSFCKNWTFNQILYQNSPRYQPGNGQLIWHCREAYQPGQPAPHIREEAFPELWDRQPDILVRLLCRSACERVHDFAVKKPWSTGPTWRAGSIWAAFPPG